MSPFVGSFWRADWAVGWGRLLGGSGSMMGCEGSGRSACSRAFLTCLALKQVRRESPARADHLSSDNMPRSIDLYLQFYCHTHPSTSSMPKSDTSHIISLERCISHNVFFHNLEVPLDCSLKVFSFFCRLLRLRSIYNSENRKNISISNSMGEYCITKIIDGLFISDSLVPLDVPFLRGNKIICALGWTADMQTLFTQDDEIVHHLLSKNNYDVKFPSFGELETGFLKVEQAREELLCALIYSENELEAALIATMYLMFHFRWDCNTAFAFVRTKMEAFEFSDQAVEGLELFQAQLRHHCSQDLVHIMWDYEFLVDYRPIFDDQALLVNTVRNKLRPYHPTPPIPSNKTLRVRWQDQIRPPSAIKIPSSKNIRRASLNKSKGPEGSCADQEVQVPQAPMRSPQGLKSVPYRNKEKQSIQQDFQFLSLKEMSRTNFNDRRYMGSKMRRKGSLRPSRPQKTQSSINLHSITALVGIYSSSTRPASGKTGLVRSGGSTAGLPFWNSLRNYSKASLAHA